MPGKYSEKQLDFQAENVATSITNNCSFNCIATKVIVTSANWPDRDRFLDKIHARPRADRAAKGLLSRRGRALRADLPASSAPTGGDDAPLDAAAERHARGSRRTLSRKSRSCASPSRRGWTPIRTRPFSIGPSSSPMKSCGERWPRRSRCPSDFRKDPGPRSDAAIGLGKLQYGTIAINHWSGLAFAMMSPAWGGVAGSRLDDAQSGIGWVHNTSMLDGIEKNVLHGSAHGLSEADVVCDPLESRGGLLAAVRFVLQAVGLEPRPSVDRRRSERTLTDPAG